MADSVNMKELSSSSGDETAMDATSSQNIVNKEGHGTDNGSFARMRRNQSLIRNLTAFWFFGLCNNYGYVIMLSAAEDILSKQDGGNGTAKHEANLTTLVRGCETLSTGAVLLADILPTLAVKLTAPFYMQYIPYGFRNVFVILCQLASFIIVAFSTSVTMSLLGVVVASFGAGLGEITYLALAAHFDKNTISTWSSGTGGAGIVGSLAYAGIIQLGVSPRDTLLIQLVIPVIMAICYWIVMVMPPSVHQMGCGDPKSWIVPITKPDTANETQRLLAEDNEGVASVAHHFESQSLNNGAAIPLKKKFQLVLPLLKFMIPLGCVYIGEYFINQGLQEFVVFYGATASMHLTPKDQYRWYQVIYQLGVFFSRSSVNFFQVKPSLLPLLPVLQFLNVAVFLTEAYYLYMPSIWIAFALIFIEGLLGGTAYVNTFYQIRQTVATEHVEFSLGVASVADSSGIVVAALTSMPLHNWLCSTPLPKNFH